MIVYDTLRRSNKTSTLHNSAKKKEDLKSLALCN